MIDLLEFNVRGDERGLLVAIEENKEVPFNVKRVFYIYATKAGVPRGRHAHYHTKQLLVAVNGSCKVTLDDGIAKKTFDLDKPSIGLFQDSMIWGTMHDFSDDCVLMVLASDIYDESDYIRDYADFLKELRND
ncbi:sugar 3,4-ketoisomerase [Francisella philomiragia]|uniref:sugar 3,4-ketoisomerase n=1 Tax=Francisella philomiragia TaxID=28110 RepID=UPI001905F879|nr:FdtA/QdtA family cupin domain-containing protein [Francisella philomiragia]MBK2092378.1 FdtA/QdtA family cupin domain-containing protein [Francisella philomiragia]MBK2257401.1 FdtA/QdtA family cupin domain-containing protein [Francisella philomiragia]MBK2270099.1 FdtA/QdtA family cupin domain-containing protein [Francisella philomiragia]MBK2271996.1 FdtA/QdtA family cupin domain-containing protein [Francisella philomiragia]MBK2275777.1 FdtA/QdtA family cupin domain-containing protein [Franc